MYPYIITSSNININVEGRPYVIGQSHMNFDRIKDAIRNQEWDDIPNLVDIPKSIERFTEGLVKVVDYDVTFDGTPLEPALANHLLRMLEEGFDARPFGKFINHLMTNPSNRSVTQLYLFIERNGMTIDEDGFVVGYKGVRSDLTDCHTGKFDNSPGNVHTMPRNQVDDDPDSACSTGFHFGAWSYASGFGPRVVLVRANPRDIVSVPKDSDAQKVRCCRYEVVREVENPYATSVAEDMPKWAVTFLSKDGDGDEVQAHAVVYAVSEVEAQNKAKELVGANSEFADDFPFDLWQYVDQDTFDGSMEETVSLVWSHVEAVQENLTVESCSRLS